MARSVHNAVALIIALASTAQAQPAFRQTNCAEPMGGTSTDLAFVSPLAAGSLLVVAVTLQGMTGEFTSITDTQGNAYFPAFPILRGPFNYSSQIWYSPSAAQAGPDTVTVTASENTALIVYVNEYTGFQSAALDVTSVSIGNGGPLSSGPVTTTAAVELLFGYAVSFGQVFNPPAGFITRGTCSADMTADRVAPTTGSLSAAFKGDIGPWSAMLATFKNGSVDGGSVDGGSVDGGSVDGGSVDGGSLDGGVRRPVIVDLGCGCHTGAGPSLLGIVALLYAARRRFHASDGLLTP